MNKMIALGLATLSIAYGVVSTTAQAELIETILLATVEAQTDPDLGSETLERAVASVSDADLPATLDRLVPYPGPGSAAVEFRGLLIRRWAENDTAAAAGWALQLPEGPAYHAAVVQVVLAWANTDMPAATTWVRALPEGDSKQAAIFNLAYEATRTEPVLALELAGTLPPTAKRDDLLVHAVSQWVGTNSEPAVIWALRVPDPRLRQRLIAAAAIALAEQDAAGAATLAVNGLVAGAEQDRAVISIVQSWAQTSPKTAASWVSQFPDMPLRDTAVKNLLALWTAQDAATAGNWVTELSTGSLREVGTMAYAQALADCDRASAVVAPSNGM